MSKIGPKMSKNEETEKCPKNSELVPKILELDQRGFKNGVFF